MNARLLVTGLAAMGIASGLSLPSPGILGSVSAAQPVRAAAAQVRPTFVLSQRARPVGVSRGRFARLVRRSARRWGLRVAGRSTRIAGRDDGANVVGFSRRLRRAAGGTRVITTSVNGRASGATWTSCWTHGGTGQAGPPFRRDVSGTSSPHSCTSSVTWSEHAILGGAATPRCTTGSPEVSGGAAAETGSGTAAATRRACTRAPAGTAPRSPPPPPRGG